jgi:hypothetical protein
MTPQEIESLIEQKLAERTASLQQELDQVKRNRDQILDEKRRLVAARKQPESEAERMIRLADRVLKIDNGLDQYQTDKVVVPRHADPATYRELKAQAEKRGVPLVFSDDAPGDPTMRNHARDQASRIKVVETDATYYANQALQRSVGIAELSRRASAAGKSLRIFRSLDDLKNDPEAVSKHQRIEEAGDPETLVFGG